MTLGDGLHKAYTRTRSNTLWTIFDHQGVPTAIYGRRNERTLPVFSTHAACEEWIMAMNLEQHMPSSPLSGQVLYDFLMIARRGGFTSVGLDPPKKKAVGFPAAPIDYFISQAEAKI